MVEPPAPVPWASPDKPLTGGFFPRAFSRALWLRLATADSLYEAFTTGLLPTDRKLIALDARPWFRMLEKGLGSGKSIGAAVVSDSATLASPACMLAHGRAPTPPCAPSPASCTLPSIFFWRVAIGPLRVAVVF